MLIPPTTGQMLAALAGPQPTTKPQRGGEPVRPQTRTAVEASERSEDSHRSRPREALRGARLDIAV